MIFECHSRLEYRLASFCLLLEVNWKKYTVNFCTRQDFRISLCKLFCLNHNISYKGAVPDTCASSMFSRKKSAEQLNPKFLIYIGALEYHTTKNYFILVFFMYSAFFSLDICNYHSYILDQLSNYNMHKMILKALSYFEHTGLWGSVDRPARKYTGKTTRKTTDVTTTRSWFSVPGNFIFPCFRSMCF